MKDIGYKIKKRMPLKYLNLLISSREKMKASDGTFVVFNTSLYSDNLGDEIITSYCYDVFRELNIDIIREYPTHRELTREEYNELKKDSIKIITGTNILSSRMNRIGLWQRPISVKKIHHLCLMGCGWSEYQGEMNGYTKLFYKSLLDCNFYHAVRDKYTEKKLLSAGIRNVLFTACPTMWKLDKIHCGKIPQEKSETCVTTVTDYCKDAMDWSMLDILLDNYKEVYLWLQGVGDLEYIKNYNRYNNIKLIRDNLDSYNSFLATNNVDYIGTRLHAGIHALNLFKRTIIIAIDNRAIEIAKSTNLPIILRKNIKTNLPIVLQKPFITSIDLPYDNIEKWKKQFIR